MKLSWRKDLGNLFQSRDSIRSRLIKIQLAVAVLVLMICSTAFIANDIYMLRRTLKQNITASARILAYNVVPTLQFQDQKEAAKILKSLSDDPTVEAVVLYNDVDEKFASYERQTEASTQAAPPLALPPRSAFKDHEWSRFSETHLDVFYQIFHDDEFLGVLSVRSTLRGLKEEYVNYFWIAISVLAAGLVLSALLATIMQKSFSKPITSFVRTLNQITESNDYSIRVGPKTKNFRIGELIDMAREFDTMLERIQLRDKDVVAANENLEQKVQERTNALEEAQKIAIQNAHAAGMSEIATGVLHNIGNIMNSVNISIEQMQETLRKTKLSNLQKLTELIHSHNLDLGAFLTHDPSGKLVPEYLRKLYDSLQHEHKILEEEAVQLNKKNTLIKDIIETQQTYARGDLMKEYVNVSDVLDDVLKLQEESLKRNKVRIEKSVDAKFVVQVPKVKLVHILINLIKNAKEAMDQTPEIQRILKIGMTPGSLPGEFVLSVTDSGAGIDPEHKHKIFSHGFTTKKTGHGFGLHFCANAMKEIGGELRVDSPGPGRGATFAMVFRRIKTAA